MQDDDPHGENPGDHDHVAPVRGRARGRGRAAHLLAAPLIVAYAWWVVALAPFSAQATAAVVLAGAVAMAVGARVRPRTQPSVAGGRPKAATWGALAAAAGAWQLAAYLHHPRADNPTLSSLANELLDSHVTRAAAFVVWIAAARGLARR